MGRLSGKVAVVTGASRGIGRGTALALASEGATVYVTGRTVSAGTSPLPGTVGETAADCDARGGKGIAVQVDHADPEQINRLFEQVKAEQDCIDILVNNVMAIPPEMTTNVGFWNKPLSNWEIWDTGIRGAYIAAWHAAQVMARQGSGLIVGMSGYVGMTYTYDVLFGTTKSATDRMMRDMAVELEKYGVAAVSLWQGFTFTERAKENLKTVPGMAAQLNSVAGSSVEFPGRVIAALASDPDAMRWSGGSLIVPELAAAYGVADIDGRMIPSLREERGDPYFKPIKAQEAT